MVCWGVCVPRGLVQPLGVRGPGARGFKPPADARRVAREAIPQQASRCPGVDRQAGAQGVDRQADAQGGVARPANAQGVSRAGGAHAAAAQERAQGFEASSASRRSLFQKPQTSTLPELLTKLYSLVFACSDFAYSEIALLVFERSDLLET